MGCCATRGSVSTDGEIQGGMPNLTLHYFNVRNRAECVRFLLAHRGINFKDHRIEFQDWMKLKPTFEFGTVPVLEFGSKKLSISTAILRYLAQKNDLYPTDRFDIYLSESTVDLINDCHAAVDKFIFKEKDFTAWDAWTVGEGLNKLKIIENRLLKVHGGRMFLVGPNLSYVDFYVLGYVHTHYFLPNQEARLAKLNAKCPVLKGYIDRVLASSQGIQAYLRVRPETQI